MIEPRRQLGLAHETLQQDVVAAQSLVEHLHHGLAAEQGLLAAIHRTEAAFVDPFSKNELADHPAAKVFAIPAPAHQVIIGPIPGAPQGKALSAAEGAAVSDSLH